MESFNDLNIDGKLHGAIDELGFTKPTPIQAQAFPIIRSGKNVVGISQTGSGKTLAFMLPLLNDLTYNKQATPRILVLVPTRELVLQIVEQIELFTKYMSVKTLAIYGGTNINTQKKAVMEGADILVATPGRLYDLVIDGTLKLRTVKKVVIDEVDVMLDLGFRFQLNNIFELLPDNRQNIMFSATMTEEIDSLIKDFFVEPEQISIALSGTPVDNIEQSVYEVHNFYTKVNLLIHLLKNKEEFKKVLVFVSGKRNADRIFEKLDEHFNAELGVIHSNKTQNFRFKAIQKYEAGETRILIATDVMARGLDLDQITHVINFNTPAFAENYMHRIGRTGRADHKGKSILLFKESEREYKEAIEELMGMKIPEVEFPEEVEISQQKTPDERPDNYVYKRDDRNTKKTEEGGASFHEKKLKNQKTNQGGKYKREIKKKYKKPKTRSGKKGSKK